MALEYVLHLTTNRDPAEALAFLSSHSAGLAPIDPLHLAGRGLTIAAFRATRPAHTVTVIFRLNKLEHTNAGRRTMLRCALRILAEDDGILLTNGEIPLCQSVQGQLTLNSENTLWADPAYLFLVYPPHRWAVIPSD